MNTNSMTRDDLAKLDDQARERLVDGMSEAERQRLDAPPSGDRRVAPAVKLPTREETWSRILTTDRRDSEALNQLWSAHLVANWFVTWRHLSRDQVADEPVVVEARPG